ncbi:hypothetical protein ACFCZT_29205, partial [Streptomyces sp. NPDC056230]|uniref:hypothetical protein n=1 Tax=Streptomyces sp. NPDC056230 TaxID=3345754 RepID=UPI0035E10918
MRTWRLHEGLRVWEIRVMGSARRAGYRRYGAVRVVPVVQTVQVVQAVPVMRTVRTAPVVQVETDGARGACAVAG